MILPFDINMICDNCGYRSTHRIPEVHNSLNLNVSSSLTAYNFHCTSCNLQYSFAYRYSSPPLNSAMPAYTLPTGTSAMNESVDVIFPTDFRFPTDEELLDRDINRERQQAMDIMEMPPQHINAGSIHPQQLANQQLANRYAQAMYDAKRGIYPTSAQLQIARELDEVVKKEQQRKRDLRNRSLI
jgi:hypothetical protein